MKYILFALILIGCEEPIIHSNPKPPDIALTTQPDTFPEKSIANTSVEYKLKKKDLLKEYIGLWNDPSTSELNSIGRALVKKNVTDCGEYYVKVSQEYSGKYLIACTRDGKNFNYYEVLPTSESVIKVVNKKGLKPPY